MAQCFSSRDVKKEEEPRVNLAEFKNGILTSEGRKKIEFKCFRNTKRNTSSFPHRILVAKSKTMCYTGSNFETETSKITSSVLKLFVVNKRNTTIKMYDVDFFSLKPQLESSEITEVKSEKSYIEKSSELTLVFGSKSLQKTINTRMKYGASAVASDANITAISETVETENKSIVGDSTSSAIPPQNTSAINVDEVYNLNDIISEEELDALSSEAEIFLDVKPETIKQWNKENKYVPFIIQFLESNAHCMNFNKAKLLCYLHYMFCFLRTGYADWKKKDPIPNVPQPFKQKLLDSFTIRKSMPQRLKDKLLAYAMVLGLKLCNYIFHFNLFSSSVKIPMTRMTSVAYALGCHILENKHNGMKTVELKLPLFKLKDLPKKRKRP